MIENKFLKVSRNTLTEEDIAKIVEMTEGYSNADLITLIKEVAMMPIRDIPTEQLLELKNMDDIRPVVLEDFKNSMRIVSPSVSHHTILEFDLWRKEKGLVV